MKLYPAILRKGKRVYLYLQKFNYGKHKDDLLKVGESVVVEGGPSTGKTSFLMKTVKKLEEANEKCIFINAALPIGDWVKEHRLFGKNLEARIGCFFRSLPDRFYLIIDNAEKITDSRKLEFVVALMEKARSTIIGCLRFAYIHPKIKVRLPQNVKVHSLGSGSDTFDITYFVVAILILIVAIIGAYNLVFLAAAIRYVFHGTRFGGRK